MHNESGPLLVLTTPLKVKMMLVIGEGQELRRVNLSPAMKNLITDKIQQSTPQRRRKRRYEQGAQSSF